MSEPPTDLERVERLEQLRALQHGLTIGVARLTGVEAPKFADDESTVEQLKARIEEIRP